MQVHLPQYQKSRLTTGLSQVSGTTGLAIGYAYMMDNDQRTAVTVAIGHAGSETIIQGSVGFEFGGSRIPAFKAAPEPAPAPAPTGMTSIPDEEYATLLMAQVQQEELEGYARQSEDRYAEQQSLLDALQQEVEAFESEAESIERLKQEAARIAAEQEARKKAYAESKAKFKARLSAKGES